MFKKPIEIAHTVHIDKDVVDHAADRMTHMLKVAGLALAIGIPAVILFGISANAMSDIITSRLK